MDTTTRRSVLRIRYARPETTPSIYLRASLPRELDEDDYWILRGSTDVLRRHVEIALSAGDVNDYTLEPINDDPAFVSEADKRAEDFRD